MKIAKHYIISVGVALFVFYIAWHYTPNRQSITHEMTIHSGAQFEDGNRIFELRWDKDEQTDRYIMFELKFNDKSHPLVFDTLKNKWVQP